MDEVMIKEAIVFAVPIVLVIIVIIIYIVKNDLDIKKKEQEDIADRQRKAEAEKAYFKSKGYSITKKIGKVVVDDIHKKWMISGTRDIFDYSDICSAKIREEKNNDFVSLYIDIKTNTTNKPLIIVPIIESYLMSGSMNLYTREFKNPAVEMEAFLASIAAQNK